MTRLKKIAKKINYARVKTIVDNPDFSEAKSIIEKWYEDGCSTWEYQGSEDGKDGMFGGSFHSMEFEQNEPDVLMLCIDFGSANREKAEENLRERLSKANFECDRSEDYTDVLDIQKIEYV